VFQHISANQYGTVVVAKAEAAGSCSCHHAAFSSALTFTTSASAAAAAALTAVTSPDPALSGLPPGAADEPDSRWVRGLCGDECENRLLRIECSGATGVGDERKDRRNDKWCNCAAGAGCGNRQISLRQGHIKVGLARSAFARATSRGD
jgi:hypothetical protein